MNKIKIIIFLIICISRSYSQLWEGVGSGFNYELKVIYEDTTENLLYVGGNFTTVDTIQHANCIAVWDGTKWDTLEGGMNHYVYAITEYKGDIYAGGAFTIAGNISANHIARWDGEKWDSVSSGLGENAIVYNFHIYNNELYVMGGFDSAGNVPANSLAKWDGEQWYDVYAFPELNGTNSNMVDAVAFYKDELYVGGNFDNDTITDIIKYNGANWENVGAGMFGSMGGINRMTVYKDELYVAGLFYKADGNTGNFIQRWDGEQWKEVGGEVYGYLQQPYSNGTIHDMKVYNDELYVSGIFSYAGGVPAQRVARWDGTQWCALGGEFDNVVNCFDFFMDTLYIGCGKVVDGDTVNWFAKWIGGDYIDTCGVVGGIEKNIFQEDNIIIYPNPAGDNITIDMENNKKKDVIVTIYDICGRQVYSEKIKTVDRIIELNLSGMSDGLYLIRIKTGDKVYSNKIIIQK